MCECKSTTELHELDCDEYVIRTNFDELNLSYRKDKERAEQRMRETTQFHRRRVLALANGSAKTHGLL